MYKLRRLGLEALMALAGLELLVANVSAANVLTGDFADFGINNVDTVLTLDCNEFFTDPKTTLFYADFRKELDLSFDVCLNTNITEQVFLCREGTRENPSAGIMVGFDPGPEKIFVEICDADGNLHRIWGGDKVELGKWLNVKIKGVSDADLHNSHLKLSVSDVSDGFGGHNVEVNEQTGGDVASMDYSGPVIPLSASRWVIGRGYPGGFRNSLQVRKGELRNLKISGTAR